MVHYEKLIKASEYMGEIATYSTYGCAFKVIPKYDDPLVWCSSLIPFLYDWNAPFFIDKIKDSASLGECTVKLLESLCKTLEQMKIRINVFRKLKLDLTSNLARYKPLIIKLYEALKQIVGATGAAKVLHLLAPNFFVMWDTSIRRAYGVNDSGEDYYRFLEKMRDEIREAVNSYKQTYNIDNYEEARNDLELILGRPLTKAIDEYNWLKYTKRQDI